MKKTLITLLALTGSVFATNVLEDVTYIGTFSGNASLTGSYSALTFNYEQGKTPMSLNSWMVTFDVTQQNQGNTTFLNMGRNPDAAPSEERYGLGVFLWGGEKQLSFAFDGNEKHADKVISGSNYQLRTDGDASYCITNPGLTSGSYKVSLAYDAEDKTAYLFVNDTLVSRDIGDTLTTSQLTLTSGTNGQTSANAVNFFTYAGKNQFTNVTVTDLSSLAGDSKAIAHYITTGVPEPATATLSLLALAGLAARRRRR